MDGHCNLCECDRTENKLYRDCKGALCYARIREDIVEKQEINGFTSLLDWDLLTIKTYFYCTVLPAQGKLRARLDLTVSHVNVNVLVNVFTQPDRVEVDGDLVPAASAAIEVYVVPPLGLRTTATKPLKTARGL
jgi:hypothetical protein